MKIALASDLHLEFGDIQLDNSQDAQVLILSGDILVAQDLHDHPDTNHSIVNIADLGRRQLIALRFREFLKRVSAEFPHVIYVAGNHEFYHGKWPLGLDYLQQEVNKFSNIHFLENNSVVIDGITFLGGTLWTNMNNLDPVTMNVVAHGMNDFNIIRNSDRNFARLTPQDVAQQHRKTVNYISQIVDSNPHSSYVVVGHHAPTKQSIKPRYHDDYYMNGAYSSELTEFILDRPQIKLWTHGHTHDQFDYQVGSTRVVCNPRGYIGYESCADHFELKFIEI